MDFHGRVCPQVGDDLVQLPDDGAEGFGAVFGAAPLGDWENERGPQTWSTGDGD